MVAIAVDPNNFRTKASHFFTIACFGFPVTQVLIGEVEEEERHPPSQ